MSIRENIPVTFIYACEDERGEPDFCTRKECLRALREGRKAWVENMYHWNEPLLNLKHYPDLHMEWPCWMPCAPEQFKPVEEDELPF